MLLKCSAPPSVTGHHKRPPPHPSPLYSSGGALDSAGCIVRVAGVVRVKSGGIDGIFKTFNKLNNEGVRHSAGESA